MSKIKLSVCIPAYNAAQWIVETLQSVLPITEAMEIIVSDNHSKDGTLERVEEFINDNLINGIKVIQPNHHLSMAENWNFVISSASGPYVVLLSADDLMSTKMCVRAIEELERDPSIDIVTFEHDRLIHGPGGKRIASRHTSLVLTEGMSTPTELILNNNPFSINFTFIRINSNNIKKIISKGNLFTRSTMTTDYDFWIRCSLMGCNIKYLANPKGCYRVHSSNLSNNRLKMLIQTFLVVARHREALKKNCSFALRLLYLRLYVRLIFIVNEAPKKKARFKKLLLKSILS